MTGGALRSGTGSPGLAGRPSPLLPLLLSLAALLILGPSAFDSGVPSNADLTAHLLPVEVLRTELLPTGRLRGWSHAWFAGFPLYWFYFPVPGLAAALLGYLVEPALALRLVTVAGVVALPWALHSFARWSRLEPAPAAGLIVVGSLFLVSTSHHGLGGNLASTVAGEFSYAWSLALGVLYLALLSPGAPGGRSGIAPGLALAAATLSHVLPAGAAAAGAAWGLRDRKSRGLVLRSWLVAGGLSAFWTVPMALRISHIGNLGWSFVPGRADVVPAELLLLLPAACIGGWLLRRNRGIAMLAAAGLFGLAVAAVPQEIVMRGRLLPVWALAVHALAGAGVGEALSADRRSVVAWGVAVGVVPLVMLLATREIGGLHRFSGTFLGGIEEKEGAPALRGLLALLREQPPGRIHWEPTDAATRWGGSLVLHLIPLWTDHTVPGGLLKESAPLSVAVRDVDRLLASDPPPPPWDTAEPDVPHDPTAAVAALRDLGVGYLVTTTTTTADVVEGLEGVRELGSVGPFRLFDLGPAPLVVASSCVLERHPPADRPSADGWVARRTDRGRTGVCAADPVSASGVRGVTLEPRRIRFSTDAPGVPHLVRTSYFPNWRVAGGEAPRLVEPNFMMVVPSSTDVVLEFRATWVEWLGWLVTGGTVLALGAVAIRSRRRIGEEGADPAPRAAIGTVDD